MNKDLEIAQSQTFFYIREKLWRTLQKQCQNEYGRFNDPFFIFWKAYGLYKENASTEAINALNTIENRRELSFATLTALIEYHKTCQLIDRETLQELKYKQDEAQRSASDKAIICTAYLYIFQDDCKKAKALLQQSNQQNCNISATVAWAEYFSGSQVSLENALEMFERNGKSNHLESLMGKIKCCERLRKFPVMLETLNEIGISFPSFLSAQTEKTRILMMIGDWEQAQETAMQILEQDSYNLCALKLISFIVLAREGKMAPFLTHFERLLEAMDKFEPVNSELKLEIARLFSRVCGRNRKVLKATMRLALQCKKRDPLNVNFALELAKQHLLQEHYDEAYACYQEAASLDETESASMQGMTLCKILSGHIEEAQQQLEFLAEIDATNVDQPKTSFLVFLGALLSFRLPAPDNDVSETQQQTDNNNNIQTNGSPQERQMQNTIAKLDEALKLHVQMSKTLPPGLQFYISLDPDYLVQIAQEYLQYISTEQIMHEQEIVSNAVVKANRLLDTVCKQIPGLYSARLLLAKSKLASGDSASASKAIEACMEMDPSNQEASILQALAQTRGGNLEGALNSLQKAISFDFQIRTNPLFMLVKAEIEFSEKDYQSALATLEQAFILPEVQNDEATLKSQSQQFQSQSQALTASDTPPALRFGEGDRCMVFVLYAKTLAVLKRGAEAKQIMTKAIQQFSGTTHEVNVLIANSQIAIESGDLQKALSILKAVSPQSPYYIQSNKIMAAVYLDHMKDRRHYAKCYTDLITHNPSASNYKLLGLALLKIQEPQDALNAFKSAQKMDTQDEQLPRLIGKALVLTHNYVEALAYFDEQIRMSPQNVDLKLELGKLCIKIGQLEKAEQLLQPGYFQDSFAQQTTESLKRNVDGFYTIYKLNCKKTTLLTKTYNAQAQQSMNIINPAAMSSQQQQQQQLAGLIETSRKALEKTIQTQLEAIERCKEEGGNIDKEKHYAADLYYQYARFLQTESQGDKQKARADQYMEKAHKHHPENTAILYELAKIYYQNNENELAEQKCLQALKIDPSHDKASLLLCDLLVGRDMQAKAFEQFGKLLNEKANNFGVLRKMITLLKRQGNLSQAQRYLSKAEQKSGRNDPGLCLCYGVYFKALFKLPEALKELSKAKRVAMYQEEAVYQMLDIYLNPEQQLYYSDGPENESCILSIENDNYTAACNLVQELDALPASCISQPQKLQLMHAYLLIFSKKRPSLEQALTILTTMDQGVNNDNSGIPVKFAIIVAKAHLSKKAEAKNQLKALLQTHSNLAHYSEEIEWSWLHYADQFLYLNQVDQSEDCLQNCLKFNQNCAKAEEMMGMLIEKDNDFSLASNHYERAWKITNESSPQIGYRLAFSYLNCKKYTECINISKKILAKSPNFPKVKNELLTKATNALKAGV